MKRWMVGLLLVPMFFLSSGAYAQSQERLPVPNDAFDLGVGWEATEYYQFDLQTGSGPAAISDVLFFQGPYSSNIRIVTANLGVLNAVKIFDTWTAFQTDAASELQPLRGAPTVANAIGCSLQESVEGIERLAGLYLGSTICLTNDGTFVWASVEGNWDANGGADSDRLAYSEASTSLVELVLGTGDFTSGDIPTLATPAA